MTKYLMLAANALMWGLLAWSGRHGTAAHAAYYEYLPAGAFILSTVAALVVLRLGWTRVATWWLAASLCALLPYLFFYTGGM